VVPLTNRDLLKWFEEHEREGCPFCGERATVRLPELPIMTFCLACAAITSGGVRLDLDLAERARERGRRSRRAVGPSP